jgi:hypothetical protein
MDWIRSAQDKDQCQAFVNMEMNVWASYRAGNFLNWAS